MRGDDQTGSAILGLRLVMQFTRHRNLKAAAIVNG
jgi:hypothetical protein